MSSFAEFLGQPTITKTKPKKGSSFAEFLGTSPTVTPQVSQTLNPPSKSPFNPNTPGNQEFIRQLEAKAPSTSVSKNFFNVDTFKTAAKDVGSLVAGKESLPFTAGKTFVEAYTKPSEYTKEIEKSLPSSPLKYAGQAFIRTIMPLIEPFGEIVGGDILAQREEADKTIFDSNIKPQTVGKQTQTVISDVLKTNKLTPKEVVDVVMASTNVGLLLAPFLTKTTKSGSVKLSQLLERETKVPISFSDLQKITSSTSNAQAISRVGESKFFAYQEAAQSNTVRQALKDGFVTLAEKEPTVFSNIFKNIATRPITEAMNFTKTYGGKVKVPTTGLLPERVSVAEARTLPPETLAKYTPKVENGVVSYALKAPATPKTAPETAINPEVAKLPALDQKDYINFIAPKEANLPAPKANETRVYYGGDGKPGGYVDTQLPVALNRGVNEKTNVLNIESSRLSSTGDPAKDARGERLLDVKPETEITNVASTDPLLTEARKYNSAEEFMKKQVPVYHGSRTPLKKFSNKKGGVFFTSEYADATGYSGGLENVYEGYLNFKKPLVIDAKGAKWDKLNTKYGESTQEIIGKAEKDGYDGIVFKNIVDNVMDTEGEGISTVYYSYKPENTFVNESQLTDIWKKANKETTSQPLETVKTMPLDRPESMPATKTSGIATSINAKAIEQGMTAKGFDDLAEFNGTTFKEQAELVSKLDPDQARAIVRGEQPLPPEIRSAALISAMEDLAKKTGDVTLMQDLANSPLATKISESASEVSLARMREQDSATMKLQEIKKARQARMEKTKSKELQKTVKTAKAEVEKVNLSKEDLQWDKFLTEITC